VIALADHFGLATFTLAGHDWGGAIAWMAALARPDRISRLIILNAPHPFLFQKSIFDDPAQRRASRYIRTIRSTRIDRSRLLRAVLGNRAIQRIAALAVGEDRAAHLDEWSQPGAMTGMLNWYRASAAIVPEDGAASGRPAFLDAPFPPIRQPTLVIWGMRDRYLLPVQLDGLDALVPDLTLIRIDAGHFVTWRAAETVTTAMAEWMRTK
jgi:pimeloyl-ACP methyl ester carboxylesterase